MTRRRQAYHVADHREEVILSSVPFVAVSTIPLGIASAPLEDNAPQGAGSLHPPAGDKLWSAGELKRGRLGLKGKQHGR